MSLAQKEVRAAGKWLGRMVRRDRSESYRLCVGVRAYGPPSGWNAVYEITCKGGYSFTVSRFNSVETEDRPRKPSCPKCKLRQVEIVHGWFRCRKCRHIFTKRSTEER